MIHFSQVIKRYAGGYEALKNISFEIEDGEMVLLSGHSGAGKSTLLNLIAGIERPTSGTVLVNGQNVGALNRAAIPYLRRNIGLIFQDHKLLFDRSVMNNVRLPLDIAGYSHQDAQKRARAALDRVGLLPKANNSACVLPAQSCIAQASCWPTNQPAIWITPTPKTSWICLNRSTRLALPSSYRPTMKAS